jgi:hypothetical protein
MTKIKYMGIKILGVTLLLSSIFIHLEYPIRAPKIAIKLDVDNKKMRSIPKKKNR